MKNRSHENQLPRNRFPDPASQFGAGVIVQVKPEEYVVTFMDHGMRDLDRDEQGLEIIDANDQDQDLVSLADIEVLLVNVIRKYSDIQERVELGGRWVGARWCYNRPMPR